MAPSDDEHQDAYRAVLERLDAMTADWRNHRDVINRAVGLLNQEVVGFAKRLDRDDAERVTRQAALDAALDGIQRWLIGLIVALGVVILVALALFVGSRWL